jgi:hypothetical protein
MAIAYTDTGGIVGSTKGVPVAPLPTGWQADDIHILIVMVRDDLGTMTITPDTWTLIANVTRGTSSQYWIYGRRAVAGDSDATCTSSLAVDTYGTIFGFRGCIATGTAWEVVGAMSADTTDPGVFAGVTSLTAQSMIVAVLGGEDNNNDSVIITSTGLPTDYTEVYQESATGTDGMSCIGYAIRAATGATGNVSCDFNTAVPVGWGAATIALKPPAVAGDDHSGLIVYDLG